MRNTHTSHTRPPTAPRVTIQTENTSSITSHHLHKHTPYIITPSLNLLQQCPPPKYCHSPPPPPLHYNGNSIKHAPYTHIYCTQDTNLQYLIDETLLTIQTDKHTNLQHISTLEGSKTHYL